MYGPHPNQCQKQAYRSASLFCLSVRLLFSVVRPVKEMRLSLVRIMQRRGGETFISRVFTKCKKVCHSGHACDEITSRFLPVGCLSFMTGSCSRTQRHRANFSPPSVAKLQLIRTGYLQVKIVALQIPSCILFCIF